MTVPTGFIVATNLTVTVHPSARQNHQCGVASRIVFIPISHPLRGSRWGNLGNRRVAVLLSLILLTRVAFVLTWILYRLTVRFNFVMARSCRRGEAS